MTSHRLIHPLGEFDEVEWRDSGDGTNMTLRGHAAVFNRLSEPLWDFQGEFREQIAPGAFTDVLHTNPDVRALINHNSDLVLARTAAKTLELSQDPTGLRVWARVAPTSYAKDLRVNMQAGNVNQMSFAFTIEDETEQKNNETGERTLTINRVGELLDVAVVTYPAYTSTDAEMRSAFIARAERNYLVPTTADGSGYNTNVAQNITWTAGTRAIAPVVGGEQGALDDAALLERRENELRLRKLRHKTRQVTVRFPIA